MTIVNMVGGGAGKDLSVMGLTQGPFPAPVSVDKNTMCNIAVSPIPDVDTMPTQGVRTGIGSGFYLETIDGTQYLKMLTNGTSTLTALSQTIPSSANFIGMNEGNYEYVYSNKVYVIQPNGTVTTKDFSNYTPDIVVNGDYYRAQWMSHTGYIYKWNDETQTWDSFASRAPSGALQSFSSATMMGGNGYVYAMFGNTNGVSYCFKVNLETMTESNVPLKATNTNRYSFSKSYINGFLYDTVRAGNFTTSVNMPTPSNVPYAGLFVDRGIYQRYDGNLYYVDPDTDGINQQGYTIATSEEYGTSGMVTLSTLYGVDVTSGDTLYYDGNIYTS